jgi:hypothetical protein
MNRRKKFILRQFGLWLLVVGIDVLFNLVLTPTDPINDGMNEAVIMGFLGGTLFAFIADKVDLHYQGKTEL